MTVWLVVCDFFGIAYKILPVYNKLILRKF